MPALWTRAGRWRLAAGAGCLALAIGWNIVSTMAESHRSWEMAFSPRSNLGEMLSHGIGAQASVVSYRMPLSTLIAARLEYHAGGRYALYFVAVGAALLLLSFAMGRLLHPWGIFIAAAAVFSAPEAFDHRFNFDSGYTLLVLLSAGLLAWRAREPTTVRSALLGAAIGASLLWRSPLAFFAPALALYEWAYEYRFSLKACRRQLLVLCVVPYLFLLPWIAMNWSIHGKLVAFEHNAANSNIVTGALGLVQDIEGNYGSLLDKGIDPKDDAAVRGWAVRQVLRHPWRFARAYALRVKYALALHPWLALFAAAGFWALRKSRTYRELGLMAAYFLGVHCFMTVEERYFWPLWPLLALTAFSLPAHLLESVWAVGDPSLARGARLAALGLKGALALVVSLCVVTSATLFRFAQRARGGGSDRDLTEALLSYPDDVWLLNARAKESLDRGDLSGAVQDYARAAALQPERLAWQLELARIEAVMGRPDRLLHWRAPARYLAELPRLRVDAQILKAVALIQIGDRRRALEHLKLAWADFKEQMVIVRGPNGEREKEILDKLRSSDTLFVGQCQGLQGSRPVSEQRALNEALAGLIPNSSVIWLQRTRLELLANRRKDALKALVRTEGTGGSAELSRQIRELRAELVPPKPRASPPAPVETWLAKTQRLAREGRREEALESLGQALKTPPNSGVEQRLLIAGLYRELQDRTRAIEVSEGLLRDFPKDSRSWILSAELTAELGRRAQALKSLDRAQSLARAADAESRHRLALAYQSLGEYDRALELFEGLARIRPNNAALYSDKALCKHLKGSREAALADLRTAISLDPGYVPAYLTLGAIYAGEGRFEEAVKVYDQALPGAKAGRLKELLLSGRLEAMQKLSSAPGD